MEAATAAATAGGPLKGSDRISQEGGDDASQATERAWVARRTALAAVGKDLVRRAAPVQPRRARLVELVSDIPREPVRRPAAESQTPLRSRQRDQRAHLWATDSNPWRDDS